MPIYIAINALMCKSIALVISLDAVYKIFICSGVPYGIGLLVRSVKCNLLHRIETVAVDVATVVRLIVNSTCANSPLSSLNIKISKKPPFYGLVLRQL